MKKTTLGLALFISLLVSSTPLVTYAQYGGGGGGPIGLFGTVNGGGGGGTGGSNGSGLVLGASTTTIPGGTTASGSGIAAISCNDPLVGYIRFGSTRNNATEVMRLQQFLQELGYKVPLDGVYGLSTEDAIKSFQIAYKAQILTPWSITVPTGFVYITTLHEINALMCPSLDLPLPVLVPYIFTP